MAYGTTTSGPQSQLRLNGTANAEDAERLKKIAEKQRIGTSVEEASTPDEINKQIDKEEKKQRISKTGKVNSARMPQVRDIDGNASPSNGAGALGISLDK